MYCFYVRSQIVMISVVILLYEEPIFCIIIKVSYYRSIIMKKIILRLTVFVHISNLYYSRDVLYPFVKDFINNDDVKAERAH